MTSREAADILRAQLLSNRVDAWPDYVVKHQNTVPMENVHSVCAIPLLRGMGGKGVFYPGSKRWSDYKQDEQNSIPMQAAQLMMLAVENNTLGAPYINVSKKANPALYARVIQCYARIKCSMHKKGDKELWKEQSSGRYAFSVSMQLDIVRAVNECRTKQNAPARPAQGPQGALALLADMGAAARQIEQAAGRGDVLERLGAFAVNGCVSGDIVPGNRTPGTLFEHMTADQMSPWKWAIFLPDQAGQDAEEEQDGDVDDMEMFRAGAGLRDWFDKVRITLTPFLEGKGYLLQLHIWDSAWNWAEEIMRLIRAEKDRQNLFRFDEPYKHYAMFKGTNFPSHGFTWDKYVRICQWFLPPDKRLTNAQIELEHTRGMCVAPDALLHPSKIFTLENTLRICREAGVDAAQCGSPLLYFENGVSKWPAVPGMTAYHYPADIVKWYHPTLCGLYYQSLPDTPPVKNVRKLLTMLEESNVFANMASGTNMAEEIRKAAAQVDEQRNVNAASAQRVMHTEQIRAETRSSVEFPTSDELFFCALDACSVEKQLQETRPLHMAETHLQVKRAMRDGTWFHGIGQELRERVDEVNRYIHVYNMARKGLQDRFLPLCQLEGDMSSVPVSKIARTTLEWYRESVGSQKMTWTRGFRLNDPELGFFGNTMLLKQVLYDRIAKVIQPVIPILAEGLFSVYEWKPGQLGFNIILHGRKAGGKTRGLLKTQIDVTCIPGTLTFTSYVTAKADQTDMHIADTIRLQDEVAEWMVDTRAAEKDPERANRMKEAMTNGFLMTTVFQDVNMPNGEKFRGSRTLTTMQNYVMACCTNKPKSDADALASRFHARTMYQRYSLPISAASYNFPVSESMKAEARMYFHKLQFGSMWAKKATMAGALPQQGPDMSVLEDISMLMQTYFKKRGISLEDNDFARVMDKIMPFARQLVYNQALMYQRYVFDLPSSPHFGKAFEPWMLFDLTPHLYATKDISLWVVTLFAEEFVSDDVCNVLKACMKLHHMTWTPDFCPLEVAARLKDPPFRWRLNKDAASATTALPGLQGKATDDQHSAQPATDETDRFSIDLNYMTLTGEESTLYSRIADATNPKLGENDVKGILKSLRHQHVECHAGPMDRNGYAPIAKSIFKKQFARSRVARQQLELSIACLRDTLNDYAKRHFRRAMLKLTNVDEDTKMDALQWGALHDKLVNDIGLTEEDVIVFYLLGPVRAISTEELGRWLRGTKEMLTITMPITEAEFQAVAVAANASLEVVRELSWTHIKVLCMAIADDKFKSPASANKSDFYYTFFCDGWKGDFRDCDAQDLNMGQVAADGKLQTARVKLPVVEFADKKIFFNPSAIGRYDKHIIVDAWLYATMCDSFEPQKFMLGWMHDDDWTKFDVLHITAAKRDELVKKLVAMGPHEEYRQGGIRVSRRGYLNPMEQEILFSVPLNGTDTAKFKKNAQSEIAMRSKLSELIENIDDKAAYAQHLLAGRPLDEPVQTPSYRMEQFLRAWRERYPGPEDPSVFGSINYPMGMVSQFKVQQMEWDNVAETVATFDELRTEKRQLDKQHLAISESKHKKLRAAVEQEAEPLEEELKPAYAPKPKKRAKKNLDEMLNF